MNGLRMRSPFCLASCLLFSVFFLSSKPIWADSKKLQYANATAVSLHSLMQSSHEFLSARASKLQRYCDNLAQQKRIGSSREGRFVRDECSKLANLAQTWSSALLEAGIDFRSDKINSAHPFWAKELYLFEQLYNRRNYLNFWKQTLFDQIDDKGADGDLQTLRDACNLHNRMIERRWQTLRAMLHAATSCQQVAFYSHFKDLRTEQRLIRNTKSVMPFEADVKAVLAQKELLTKFRNHEHNIWNQTIGRVDGKNVQELIDVADKVVSDCQRDIERKKSFHILKGEARSISFPHYLKDKADKSKLSILRAVFDPSLQKISHKELQVFWNSIPGCHHERNELFTSYHCRLPENKSYNERIFIVWNVRDQNANLDADALEIIKSGFLHHGLGKISLEHLLEEKLPAYEHIGAT
jgi:hypothetical protein